MHSPGPCIYSPEEGVKAVKHSASSYTMPAKGSSYFDAFLDPERQTSPGPLYNSSHLDYRSRAIWGEEPRATFGRCVVEC